MPRQGEIIEGMKTMREEGEGKGKGRREVREGRTPPEQQFWLRHWYFNFSEYKEVKRNSSCCVDFFRA